MEKETRRRRKQQTPVTRPPTTTVHDIPDHLLNDIIVNRLRCHVSHIRAAAVCKRWRRVASTRGNRDYNRHDFFTCIGHYHATGPSSSTSGSAQRRRHAVFVPVSRTINARHFSLDFLPAGPGGRPWELVDGSGSLLLLAVQRRGLFPDLVVCEPVSRRHVRIHPIPEMKYSRCLGAFLGYNWYNVIAMSSFRVTCVLCDPYLAEDMEEDDGVSFVTARAYNHRAPQNSPTQLKSGWDTSRKATAASRGIHLRSGSAESAHFAGRAWGTVFFGVEDDGSVFSLDLDNSRGKFSHFRLPEHVRASRHRSTFRFAENVYAYPEPAMPRLVSLFGHELRVFLKRQNNDGSIEWMHEKSLRLHEATRDLPGHKECYITTGTAKIVAASVGCVVLTPAEETWLFSVELRTMRVERDHSWKNRVAGEVYPYELQTPPKVNACVVDCRRGRGGVCRPICKCE